MYLINKFHKTILFLNPPLNSSIERKSSWYWKRIGKKFRDKKAKSVNIKWQRRTPISGTSKPWKEHKKILERRNQLCGRPKIISLSKFDIQQNKRKFYLNGIRQIRENIQLVRKKKISGRKIARGTDRKSEYQKNF